MNDLYLREISVNNGPISEEKSNRLLAEPASGREFEGESERRTGMYKEVHEDSSTESTAKLPAEVGLSRVSDEWFHYHRITKREIFDCDTSIIYDYNHPSITDINNSLYVFYKACDIIGTLIIQHHDKDIAVLRLIAIDNNSQSQGYGTILIKQAEQIIINKAYKKILLHAAPRAYNFYVKNGYSEMDFSFDQSAFADSIDMGKILYTQSR